MDLLGKPKIVSINNRQRAEDYVRRHTMTDQTTTAREIAASLGCSLQTVMNKAKALGIKFKGRTATQHADLLAALDAVNPRPRKAATRRRQRKTLADRIAEHLAAGVELIAAAQEELHSLDQETAKLESQRKWVADRIAALKTEQAELGNGCSVECVEGVPDGTPFTRMSPLYSGA